MVAATVQAVLYNAVSCLALLLPADQCTRHFELFQTVMVPTCPGPDSLPQCLQGWYTTENH